MKQINIRAYRIINSNDIAISSQELLDFLNMDLGDAIGNDEKLIALNEALNNKEHNIPIRERFSWVLVDESKTICKPDCMLSIKFRN